MNLSNKLEQAIESFTPKKISLRYFRNIVQRKSRLSITLWVKKKKAIALEVSVYAR